MHSGVLVPYKITLLSNGRMTKSSSNHVLVPYKITLLSNRNEAHTARASVLVPYKITLLSNSGTCADIVTRSFSTL